MHIVCNGGWGPYGYFHHCDEHHGAVDIHNAIPYSCDTFYYMLGDKLGIDRIVKYADEFGYGQKTGIDLPGEQAGLMPSPEWLIKNFHHRWYPDETLDVAIGQGAVEATPIQLARIIGGIASGGHLVRPHVVFPDQLSERLSQVARGQLSGNGRCVCSHRSGELGHHHRRHGRGDAAGSLPHRRRGRACRASTLPARPAPRRR